MRVKFFFATILSFGFLHSLWASEPLISESKLTMEEKKIFQRIIKAYPSFHYSDQVRRYYRLHPETKQKIPILVELILPKKNGFYFDEYLSYSVTLEPYTHTVTYSYDAGTASRGNGTIFVTPRSVIKVVRGCGVTACITQVFRNGKQLHEEEN